MAIQDNLVAWMEKVQENLAKNIGPFGEPQSTKDQMAAFDDMTADDWLRMGAERGPVETRKFLRAMLRRKAISEAQRRPI